MGTCSSRTGVERTRAFRLLWDEDGKPSRKTSTQKVWWPQRDSNPRLGLERASPWVVISPTSLPGATARCHSAGSSAAGPRASAVGRSTRARDERAQDFQSFPYHSRRYVILLHP